MRNDIDSSAAAITTLMHAIIEMRILADKACEHISRDSEYADATVPHALALIQQQGEQAIQKASAMLEADIRELEIGRV
ncbi:hypothetical protein [uncultured Serratia sp.]|uniref:hypothetical protein n=1 Tax=uncultured Serratia sp. TaxID=239175 RepID=UPI002583C3C7|nr:hypothetical protein [uncultured Serratia sp.]